MEAMVRACLYALWFVVCAGPLANAAAAEGAKEGRKLPPGFDRAFISPTSDRDQYGNRVVKRRAVPPPLGGTTGGPHRVANCVRPDHGLPVRDLAEGAEDGARADPFR